MTWVLPFRHAGRLVRAEYLTASNDGRKMVILQCGMNNCYALA